MNINTVEEWIEPLELDYVFDGQPLSSSISTLVKMYDKMEKKFNHKTLILKKQSIESELGLYVVRNLTEEELINKNKFQQKQNKKDYELFLLLKQRFEPND